MKAAVIGVGHLGKHHARILASLPEEHDYITRDGQHLKVTDSGQR